MIKKEKKIYIVSIVIIMLLVIGSVSFIFLKLQTYDELSRNLNDLKAELNSANTQLQTKQDEYEETLEELQNLRSGNEYDLHDPTSSEVTIFINQIKDSYSFAELDTQIINSEAETKGIRCGIANIIFNTNNEDIDIITFNTTDESMIYFDPILSYWVENLEVGNDYYSDCVIYDDGLMSSSDFSMLNSIIKEILFIW